MVLIGVVEWRGGDQCGGFLDWQDWRWWVSALWLSVRSTVSLCFFFPSWWLCGGCFLWMWLLLVVFEVFFVSFFPLWWLFLAVVVGGWWVVWVVGLLRLVMVWCLSGGFGDFLWWVSSGIWQFVFFFSLVFIFLVVLVVAVPCVCCCWWVCSDVSGSGGVWVLKIFFYGVF